MSWDIKKIVSTIVWIVALVLILVLSWKEAD
jgi:hypothetical protein